MLDIEPLALLYVKEQKEYDNEQHDNRKRVAPAFG